MHSCKNYTRIVFSLLAFLSISTLSVAQQSDSIPPPVEFNTTVDSAVIAPAAKNFDSISAGDISVVVRRVDDSSLRAIKNDEAYWYANLAPQREKIKQQSAPQTPAWLNTLLWTIVIGGFVGILILYLASSDIRLFRKKPVVINTAEEETISEDIFEINYDRDINSAVSAANYRLATRLMYLRTLRELSDKELIQYKHERTNSDYLFQLAGTSYYRDFFRLTRDFEYTWYGQFQLSPEAFEIVQKDFSTFKKQLP